MEGSGEVSSPVTCGGRGGVCVGGGKRGREAAVKENEGRRC